MPRCHWVVNSVHIGSRREDKPKTVRLHTKRPLLRPAEVLETIPGLVVTLHSDDGKANQYFLQGFNLFGAREVSGNDNPWEHPENFKMHNGVLGLTSGKAANGFSLTSMAYQVDWIATEQVPERTIARGGIGRYGALKPNGCESHCSRLIGHSAQPICPFTGITSQ